MLSLALRLYDLGRGLRNIGLSPKSNTAESPRLRGFGLGALISRTEFWGMLYYNQGSLLIRLEFWGYIILHYHHTKESTPK